MGEKRRQKGRTSRFPVAQPVRHVPMLTLAQLCRLKIYEINHLLERDESVVARVPTSERVFASQYGVWKLHDIVVTYRNTKKAPWEHRRVAYGRIIEKQGYKEIIIEQSCNTNSSRRKKSKKVSVTQSRKRKIELPDEIRSRRYVPVQPAMVANQLTPARRYVGKWEREEYLLTNGGVGYSYPNQMLYMERTVVSAHNADSPSQVLLCELLGVDEVFVLDLTRSLVPSAACVTGLWTGSIECRGHALYVIGHMYEKKVLVEYLVCQAIRFIVAQVKDVEWKKLDREVASSSTGQGICDSLGL